MKSRPYSSSSTAGEPGVTVFGLPNELWQTVQT